ncbi:MAG: Gfo/Idh/MocA family oxidoreductase [Clostridia bacterium]|nr:Gfo/Idh/MocA family oxidoreductase [Clostridia bacterium]
MKEKIKIGYIGLGRRGRDVLKRCLCEMPDVEITMICDVYEPLFEKINSFLKEKGRQEAVTTTDYRDILKNPEIDAVFIMTGWDGRTEIIKDAMYAGKYVGFEVGCVFDIQECYELLRVYEQTNTPIMMLENCCYGRLEMMALNVQDKGLFGEIIHAEGGYHHDLVSCHELFGKEEDEDRHYRIHSYINRNCEQYPTHELGPICKVLGINRGNKMLTLSSFASKAVALGERIVKENGPDGKWANYDYKQGDIITTVITCANGQTIRLCLDTTAPSPHYSRNFTIRGSRGMCSEESKVLFFDGMEEPCRDNLDEMFKIYDHPLHEEYVTLGEKGGHGGKDWLVCRAFVESVKNGTNTPIDAYDSILWLAIAPLSEASIKLGGAPVPVPDFTCGKWADREPVTESKYCLDKVVTDKTVSIFPK